MAHALWQTSDGTFPERPFRRVRLVLNQGWSCQSSGFNWCPVVLGPAVGWRGLEFAMLSSRWLILQGFAVLGEQEDLESLRQRHRDAYMKQQQETRVTACLVRPLTWRATCSEIHDCLPWAIVLLQLNFAVVITVL